MTEQTTENHTSRSKRLLHRPGSQNKHFKNGIIIHVLRCQVCVKSRATLQCKWCDRTGPSYEQTEGDITTTMHHGRPLTLPHTGPCPM